MSDLEKALNVPFRFWTCPHCDRPRIEWLDKLAFCLTCGACNMPDDPRVMDCRLILRSLRFTHEWYAARWERLRLFVEQSSMSEKEKKSVSSIMANEVKDPYEPPTYSEMLIGMRHRCEQMALALNRCHQQIGEKSDV